MITIRLKSIGENKPLTAEIVDGENLSQAVTRVVAGTPIEGKTAKVFNIALNGVLIDSEEWDKHTLKKDDNVLIVPRLGGDNSTLRSLAVLGITIAAAYFAGPAGYGLTQQWAISGIAAGASILGSLAINSLFPPPNAKNVGQAGEIKDSQMYTITGQSNKVNKLGYVPKVYGTHRVFPTVAANPYTEFEANSDGKLIQYLYAIYDFGLGPLTVDDIRIGETPISDFSDLDMRLVDFNRPATPEGSWDEVLDTDLKYYKGDVTTDNVGVTLAKNASDTPTPPSGDFQAVRTAATNPEARNSELIVTLSAPQGLVSYSAQGLQAERKVFLDIEFAKEGTEDWKAFNDTSVVYDFRAAGGDLTYSDVNVNFPTTETVFIRSILKRFSTYAYSNGKFSRTDIDAYGYLKGTTSIVLNTDPNIVVGSILRCSGEVMGIVASITSLSPTTSRYTFEVPLTRNFEPVKKYTNQTRPNSSSSITTTVTYEVANKIYRGIPSLKRVVMRGNGTDPVYATYKFFPRENAQFKVRVTRVQSTSAYSKQIVDTVVWNTLATRLDNIPIKTDKRHVFLEMRIRATNQLNGSISNLSGTCTSVLDQWNGTSWVKGPTNNPAWIFADLLTGQVNKRAVDKSRLDVQSLYDWAQFCEAIPPSTLPEPWSESRFTCNFVLDFATTLQQIVEKVSSTAQASLSLVDGKYGVLIDRQKTVPVQVFTPINSSGFSSSRTYPKPPHALDMQYIDPVNGWEGNTVRVYADGYDELTATEIEEVDTFGVTSYEQAWRQGRYHLAQNKLRQENITIEVDYEHLICQRGDYVQLVQDAMLAGGRAAKVKSIDGNEVTMNDAFDNIAEPWGYVFRNKNTGVIDGGVATPVDARTFELVGPLPGVGDLIVFGAVTKVVLDCVVKAITPKDDFAATLTLVEKADAIHDSETGGIIGDYDPQISPVRPTDFLPPGPVTDLLVADAGYNCANGDYEHYVLLDWEAPIGFAYELFEVYVDFGDGMAFVANTRQSIYNYIVDNANLDKPHTFKVLAVSSSGLKLQIIAAPSVEYTPLAKTSPPSTVVSLRTDITNEVLQLSWDLIPDCDVQRYLLRYSPLLDGVSWSSSIPIMDVSATTSTQSVQARTGTYFIKAVDFNGRESASPAIAITTVPNLFNLNVIEEISDTPAFDGPKDRVVKQGSSLVLQKAVIGTLEEQEYYTEGYYYYRQIVDLGDIYTARIQSSIQASGFTEDDVIANWDPLSDVVAMATATVSDWDVETQYRVSDIRNVIADWEKLEDIDPLSEGVQANFSEWRKFTMGDATGRVFQFRLKLISKKPNVTPQVFDGSIRVDMPDRVASYQNVVAPVTGIDIVYDPAFAGPGTSPNVQISIEDAEAGDRPEYIAKTLTNLNFRIVDSTGTPVERVVDVFVKGYGHKNNIII